MSGLEYNYGRVGPVAVGDGVAAGLRQGKTGELVEATVHGALYESASRYRSFGAANQAAQAISVALTTTYTGLCLSNPAGSGFLLVPLRVGWAETVATASVASMHIIGGNSSAGVTVHTAALTPFPGNLGGSSGAAGKADSQATIVNPFYIMPLRGGFTSAALHSESPTVTNLNGAIVLIPGSWIAIGALTAQTGIGSIYWEEVPIV